MMMALPATVTGCGWGWHCADQVKESENMSTTVEEVVNTTTSELTEQAALTREYEKEMIAFRDVIREKQYEIADDSRRRRFRRVVEKLTSLCWDLTSEKKQAEENLLRHLIADPEAVGSGF